MYCLSLLTILSFLQLLFFTSKTFVNATATNSTQPQKENNAFVAYYYTPTAGPLVLILIAVTMLYFVKVYRCEHEDDQEIPAESQPEADQVTDTSVTKNKHHHNTRSKTVTFVVEEEKQNI